MIQTFIQDFTTGLQFPHARIDYVVLNAGILNYPNVGLEMEQYNPKANSNQRATEM